jgi:hypothetical protein
MEALVFTGVATVIIAVALRRARQRKRSTISAWLTGSEPCAVRQRR